MADHQFLPIKDEKKFEEFICDLFNEIENTKSYSNNIDYQIFGVKGQNQKGIDIISQVNEKVIQCKLKNIEYKDEKIRKNLLKDIEADVERTKELKFHFKDLIFASTFRDDAQIQEYIAKIKQEKNIDFNIHYWGWDTIQRHLKGKKNLLEKYYPDFIIEQTSEETTFLKKLSLKKKIEKDFKGWLSYFPKDWERRGRMMIRSFNDKQYPHSQEPDEYGEYPYFPAEIRRLYSKGMEFIYRSRISKIRVFEDGSWTSNFENENERFYEISVWGVGQINFSDIVGYDMDGDGIDNCPHIFCKFNYRGLPFENTYFYDDKKNIKFHLENARQTNPQKKPFK